MAGKATPRLNLAGASTGQKAALGVVAFLVIIAVANGGDSEADDTARPRSDSLEELASPATDNAPRLTYARRPSSEDRDFRPPPFRNAPEEAPPSSEDQAPPSGDRDVPRLTYLPDENLPPVTPSAEPSPPPTTVQETTEARPAAPANPGRTASGGAPVGQLARTGAAASLTAIAGVGLIYTGTSLRDRIRRARRRPYGRTVPRPGEGTRVTDV